MPAPPARAALVLPPSGTGSRRLRRVALARSHHAGCLATGVVADGPGQKSSRSFTLRLACNNSR